MLHVAHDFGISGNSEQSTLNNLLETGIKPNFFELLNRRRYRNALRLATSYRLFSKRPDNLNLLQELRCHLNAPELIKALAALEMAKDMEELGSYTQCDSIYVVEVSPVLDRLGHAHAATDIALSQKCRDNTYEKEGGKVWDLILEYRAFDYPAGLFEGLKKALRRAERFNDTPQLGSIWFLGRNLVSHARWSLASWHLSHLYIQRLSQHASSRDACLKEGQILYNTLQTTGLEFLKASVANLLGNEYLKCMDGENAERWGQLCESSMSQCSSRQYPDASLIILQGRLLSSLQRRDISEVFAWARIKIQEDINNGYPEKASAKCQALLTYIALQSPVSSTQSILITEEFHVKNEALKNQIQAHQPRPAAELWEAAMSLIQEGKTRTDLVREEAALELFQKHHRVALHTGNIPLVADNERQSAILCCEMFEKSKNAGVDKKWLIDRAFELMFSAMSSYLRHADLENNMQCAFWLAKISFEKSLHGWSGEPEVLDRCRIAEELYHQRRKEVERLGGCEVLEGRGMLVEIYRFAIQTCESSGDTERARVWRDKYSDAVT